ncbi:unnamed protein product [Durusdinium trenchii]|uniref:Potassium channel tetramerisation-type BTB domain-containing protein n=2 Tax=Durusdinium trenchii TaxID=1381693 RepID=A0ABP0NI89_9DINO
MASKPDLVTFNVSGKIYQVLWEPTLSLHPNSLLTQLAEDKQDDKEIFVEGDQDLFKYVLEYHRDRKILLPQHVSMAAVQRELMRFGLDVSPREWGALDKACACQTLLGSCMLGCASHRTWRTYWIWQRLLPASRRIVQDGVLKKLGEQKDENAALLLVSITAPVLIQKAASSRGMTISASFDEVRKQYSSSLEHNSVLQSLFRGFDESRFKESMTALAASLGYTATFPHSYGPYAHCCSTMVTWTPAG